MGDILVYFNGFFTPYFDFRIQLVDGPKDPAAVRWLEVVGQRQILRSL